MTPSSADSLTVAMLRRLALKPGEAYVAKQVWSDLMAHRLTIADVCDAIIEAIDAGERVKPTLLHSFKGRVGQPAYEIERRIGDKVFYLKVAVDDPGGPGEHLAVLSVHPPH